ncbi:MAG: thioesterase family protein [Bdellovibrionaceae bacterium]|nr:thioesterase family protein [Pseudobdellovibrionaceae bacterium]
MSQVFRTTTRIRFRQGDPARISYFANVFDIAHDTFEEFIVAAGYSWPEWFSHNPYIIPIRHAEADYLAPLYPGEVYDIEATVQSIGNTSFVMQYKITSQAKIHAVVKMVHSVLKSPTMEKTEIPALMRERLSRWLVVP